MHELADLNPKSDFPSILFQDDFILILFKPAGWFVHPPENPVHRRGLKRKTCVQWLMDAHSIKASPAHRLDVGTEGVLIFGKTKPALKNLNQQFLNQKVKKTYNCVVRGWLKEPSGKIDLPLELDSTKTLVPSTTIYKTLSKIEKNVVINPKFATSRYSLLEAEPETGRWHQIRRHMNRVSHPIIGDSEHGDLRHNRFFREDLKIPNMCLRAKSISFLHPENDNEMFFQTPHTERWEQIENLFQFRF
jgi:tRNA pseudouridine65 synthase